MEDSRAREQTAEQNVLALLDESKPLGDLLQAYTAYRELWLTNTCADFGDAEKRLARLWQVHVAGKNFFQNALRKLRKVLGEHSVEARKLATVFKEWVKECTRFYRRYICLLNATFGGIPELEAVAHKVKQEAEGESSLTPAPPELRAKVLASCHQTLVYLGDLSRYRAMEKLDKTQDFGPAIGYYDLAATLRPESGLGHHQLAVVALEQRHHLRGIYHLYRAMLVDQPHPAAASNLKLALEKANAAWDKNELIPKGAPGDPEAPKHILTGWFVRMHAMCAKGEEFTAHEALEREVLSQLAAVLAKSVPALESTFARMTIVNISAQYQAGMLFQERQTSEDQNAFFYFFRLNVKWFSALLHAFHDDVRAIEPTPDDEESVTQYLTQKMRLLLPSLRLYSAWLTSNIWLLAGLAHDDFLRDIIHAFWSIYAPAMDLLADDSRFGVWVLEEHEIDYMLPEDADTIGFQPLHQQHQLVRRNWLRKSDGTPKPRFSDANVVRHPEDEEMIARLKHLLDDGSFLAHEENSAPIGIVEGRIYYGTALSNAIAAAEEAKKNPAKPMTKVVKPLSYAAAAAANASKAGAVQRNRKEHASNKSISRTDQLAKMIDSVVHDTNARSPKATPPPRPAQPAVATHAATVTNGRSETAAPNDGWTTPKSVARRSRAMPVQPPQQIPIVRPISHNEREKATAGAENDMPTSYQIGSSLDFPSGLPAGTLSPPAPAPHQAHSRVNSANSIRSMTSQNGHGQSRLADSWPSPESASPHINRNSMVGTPNAYRTFGSSDVASPLLFGAGGGSIWSTGANGSLGNGGALNGSSG